MVKTCRTYSGYNINWKDSFNQALRNFIDNDIEPDCPVSSGHMKDGRGNIAPATIILPTLAMEAKAKATKDGKLEFIREYFMDILDKAIEDCKDQLLERFNWICAQSPKAAKFMYENKTFYHYNGDLEKEGIRGALKHGTLAIGQIGLAEALQILIGCDHTEEKGMEFALEIEQLFDKRAKEYKEQYKLNFGVYYTPAENLCFTAMKKFQKKYGLIDGVSAYKDETKVVDGMIAAYKEKYNKEPSEEELKEMRDFAAEKINISYNIYG